MTARTHGVVAGLAFEHGRDGRLAFASIAVLAGTALIALGTARV